jgi:tryptophanyl-tRNA synthetase
MLRVFSGIQPSGELHIGNYLGAVRNWVELQRKHECFICIVDYHAITQDYDASTMQERTWDLAIGLLAAGIDPESSVLFVQSHVAEHTELCWLLTTVTPVGELERMTQFKDKSQRQESVGAGLLNYPVLQAADVLLYKANLVPVGEDQVQHVELMREIARKWNARFGADFFPEPQPMLTPAKRIMGLDGESKMSKSMNNTIGMLDAPERVWELLRPAKTDPARVTKKDPGTPEKCNLYTLHQYFSPPDTVRDVAHKCRTAGWGCLDCKRVLADSISAHFAPMRER